MKTRERKKSATKDAIQMFDELYAGDEEFDKLVREAEVELSVAQQIYKLRKEAGLTQAELAKMIGTKHSAISRLEDADYGKQSMAMLERVANALGKKVKIEFVDA